MVSKIYIFKALETSCENALQKGFALRVPQAMYENALLTTPLFIVNISVF